MTPQTVQPKAYVGFEHINRYWDKRHDCWSAKILPGEFYVTGQPECIATVLGSCISVCIRDTTLKLGGMNHFMLPMQQDPSKGLWGDPSSAMTRYGNWAIEYLINEIIKRGGRREHFEVKVFGGGQVMRKMTDIGQKNILFTFDYLQKENLKISASDVGDIYPRKIVYDPLSGRVKLKRLESIHNQTIVSREQQYMDTLSHQPPTQDVELF